jgi:hypothetical protein
MMKTGIRFAAFWLKLDTQCGLGRNAQAGKDRQCISWSIGRKATKPDRMSVRPSGRKKKRKRHEKGRYDYADGAIQAWRSTETIRVFVQGLFRRPLSGAKFQPFSA